VAARPASHPLPARFGVGRTATEGDISVLDIDIMPDGTGLPQGRGTAADGSTIYTSSCSACHGVDLEGTLFGGRLVPPPDALGFPDGDVPISTKAIGNYWPYATTVFDYVRRAMPLDRPGSLSDDDVYAITAYLLWKNGLIDETAVMSAETLPVIQMPAWDRFIVDDRLGSDRVR
jgi:cytochrome c